MRATSNDNHSSQTHHKKGVTFDAMETLERNSNCTDKLTSLVSNMKMAIDRKQSLYKPKIYQGRSRNQNTSRQKVDMIINLFNSEEKSPGPNLTPE